MKNTVLLFALCLSYSFYSQTEIGQILKNSGDKLIIYDGSNSNESKAIRGLAAGVFGPMGFNDNFFYYFDAEGGVEKIQNTEYSEVNVGNGQIIFMTLPHSKAGMGLRVHRIIAKSKKYILGNYTAQDSEFFYIFDNDKNLIEERIPHSETKKVSQKAIEKVKEYFGDCPKLIEGMETNFANPFQGMTKKYFLLLYVENGDAVNFLSNIECN